MFWSWRGVHKNCCVHSCSGNAGHIRYEIGSNTSISDYANLVTAYTFIDAVQVSPSTLKKQQFKHMLGHTGFILSSCLSDLMSGEALNRLTIFCLTPIDDCDKRSLRAWILNQALTFRSIAYPAKYSATWIEWLVTRMFMLSIVF